MATSAPPPPPPSPPPASYSPPPTYQPAPTAVKMPSWLDLGLIIMGVGALLVLVGFLFGDAAAGQFGNGTLSTFQSDLEFFFVLTGIGFLLVVGGWMFRVVNPQWKAAKANASTQSPAATTVAPSPPPVTPIAVPATPACANCGKPTTYIAQYGRYYCYACARYV